jgi:hypothetical protein
MRNQTLPLTEAQTCQESPFFLEINPSTRNIALAIIRMMTLKAASRFGQNGQNYSTGRRAQKYFLGKTSYTRGPLAIATKTLPIFSLPTWPSDRKIEGIKY